MKTEMIDKAIKVLDQLSRPASGPETGWMLLVEQSQSDKMGHILEFERSIYEVIEMDQAVSATVNRFANDKKALTVVTSDHAQPQTIIGVALTGALVQGVESCFKTSGGNYPVTLGNASDPDRPCDLQDAIGTFNDATFPTYEDRNHDGFPDDPDPSIKLIIEDGGRPTYSTTYLTNFVPLKPVGARKDAEGKAIDQAALPNPSRQPNGLLMTGNMPTRNVKGGANKTGGAVDIAPHAGDDVLVSAQGAGEKFFNGFAENTEMVIHLTQAFGAKKVDDASVAASGKMVGW
jgi:alkaline phosphatase